MPAETIRAIAVDNRGKLMAITTSIETANDQLAEINSKLDFVQENQALRADLEAVRQLLSDTQATILNIQSSLG